MFLCHQNAGYDNNVYCSSKDLSGKRAKNALTIILWERINNDEVYCETALFIEAVYEYLISVMPAFYLVQIFIDCKCN